MVPHHVEDGIWQAVLVLYDRAARTWTHAPTTSSPHMIRLVGAVLAEQHDEWTEMRRYIGLDIPGQEPGSQHRTECS